MQGFQKARSVRTRKPEGHGWPLNVSASRNRRARLKQVASFVRYLGCEVLRYYGAIKRVREKQAEQIHRSCFRYWRDELHRSALIVDPEWVVVPNVPKPASNFGLCGQDEIVCLNVLICHVLRLLLLSQRCSRYERSETNAPIGRTYGL